MKWFSVKLDSISNGWATVTFSDTEISITLEVSYVPEDTLSELLNGAIRLLDGRSSEIKMNLEPQEVILSLIPSEDMNFIARIDGHEFIDSKLRFARQILKIFDAYSYYHDQDTYDLNWRYPFPISLVARLRQMIDTQESVIVRQ